MKIQEACLHLARLERGAGAGSVEEAAGGGEVRAQQAAAARKEAYPFADLSHALVHCSLCAHHRPSRSCKHLCIPACTTDRLALWTVSLSAVSL